MENLETLVKQLSVQSSETPWLEFKMSKNDPEMIGKNISALANSATYLERKCSYMIWGIDDLTHKIVGTNFNQYQDKVGNQELESWLRQQLSKNAEFEFHTLIVEGKDIVLLIVHKAIGQPVTFRKETYIRVGSYTKKIQDNPTLQIKLWDKLRGIKCEEMISKKDLTSEEALTFISYETYFDMKDCLVPTNIKDIMHYMIQEYIVVKQDNGLYGITCMGALLLAKRLDDFSSLARKAMRIVQYRGNDKLEILKESTNKKGYAVGFGELIQFIGALLPSEENIKKDGIRETKTVYPSVAIREIVANALIHQDLSISGMGPVIEIFESRIEVTNPGIPLIDINRIIDNPPKSRNENLATLMRRLKICEELGTGWDKIVTYCEAFQMSAPKIKIYEESMKVILYGEIKFSDMMLEDKLWACYLHACIKRVSGEYITNRTLRERFGLSEKSSASISRLIKEAVASEMIKPIDSTTAPKHMKYIPFWA